MPKYRGCSPLTAAILSDDLTTRVTVQTLAQKFDQGDIITQSGAVEIGRKNLLTLGMECGQIGADLFLTALDSLADGTIEYHSQNGESSYTRKATSDDHILDFKNQTSTFIEKSYRAFHLPVYFTLGKHKFYPVNLTLEDDKYDLSPGEKFILHDKKISGLG